jgi:hypothetical protein
MGGSIRFSFFIVLLTPLWASVVSGTEMQADPGGVAAASLSDPPTACVPPTGYLPPGSSPAPDTFRGWEFGATGETVFEHTRAGLRDPHFGMRLYYAEPVPGTLSPIPGPYGPGSDAAAASVRGDHIFWDVAFGERMPVATWFDVNPQHARFARGLQINLEAGVFMLLDFDSQSAGVIDTDYRLGASVDFRPPADFWEHLSLSAGIYHESTHLGDEYVLSAATIQGNAAPSANSQLYYRANPSYIAVPVTVSADMPFGRSHLSGRVYGGVEDDLQTDLPNGGFPSTWKAGAELRWTTVDGSNVGRVAPDGASLTEQIKANVLRRSTGVHRDQVTAVRVGRTRTRRGAFSFEAAYEVLAKRRYDHIGVEPGPAMFVSADGYWYVQHAMVMALYNLDTERSSSNAVGLSLDWIDGRSPFGQLTQYTTLRTLAVGLQYYW